MPFERDLSITITTCAGKQLSFTPRDPLPPESHFHPPPALSRATPRTTLTTPTPPTPAITEQKHASSNLQSLKMLLKTKKPRTGTKTLITGTNSESMTTDPSAPTIMHRFRSLWTHSPKKGTHPQIEATSQQHQGPSPRGRPSSWCTTCHGSEPSMTLNNQAACSCVDQVGSSDTLTSSEAWEGEDRNPGDGVLTQRFQRVNDRAEELMSTSILRSPTILPVFADDVHLYNPTEHQQDGNIGSLGDGVAQLRTHSRESLVDITFDSLAYHSPDAQTYDDGLPSYTSISGVVEENLMQENSGGPGNSASPGEAEFMISPLPQEVGERDLRMPIDSLLDDLVPEDMINDLALSPELSPAGAPVLSQQTFDLPRDLADAMSSNLTPKPRPMSGSSIYSSPPTGSFHYRQINPEEQPVDSVQAYLDGDWPTFPLFSIDRGVEGGTESALFSMSPLASATNPLSAPGTLSRAFSIERGHTETAMSSGTAPVDIVHPGALPIPTKPHKNRARAISNAKSTEQQLRTRSSFGSSFMEISHHSARGQEDQLSRPSIDFSMVTLEETLPAAVDAVGVAAAGASKEEDESFCVVHPLGDGTGM